MGKLPGKCYIDFEDTNKFQQVSEFANMEFSNNED
jgi:hypothetical protein